MSSLAAYTATQPDVLDRHVDPCLYNAPRVGHPRTVPALGIEHIGPDSKCHVTSPHGIKALLRAENTNRWLKCLQQDSPQQPGKYRALPVVKGCSICSAKMPRGRAARVPTMPTESSLQCCLAAAFAEDHLLLKNIC